MIRSDNHYHTSALYVDDVVYRNNKNSGGGLNGGDNNNKPPSGPLSSSSSSDDGKEKAEGFFKELWSNYNNNLESNPILTKALTSLTGFALGDFLAQKFIDKKVISSSGSYAQKLFTAQKN